MPLKKLRFKPGINKEVTTLAGSGGWFSGDKIRFRSGAVEKIGGWVADLGTTASALKPSTGSFWGVGRSIWNWLSFSKYNLLSVGTNLKFYIQNSSGGLFNDVTPIRTTTAVGAVTFAATSGSTTLTVTNAGHGAQATDFVMFSGAVSLGGAITGTVLNTEFQIVSVLNSTTYTINTTVAANASDTGNGGTAVVGQYQISTGAATYTIGTGWGAGGWGVAGWGSPATTGIGQQLRTWSQSNFGENLVMNPRGGGIYYWDTNSNPNIYDRATLITATDAPTVCNYVFVADAARFVLAFGVNDYGSAVQDPMLVRWSDQETITSWTPAITNQAGSYRLSRGSQIITAVQSRQEILVFTDAAVYSMQYQGPPFVWGFNIIGDNISIAGPSTAVTVNNTVYWMGTDKFYIYTGRVETLPSDIRQYVFQDINLAQAFQFFAGTNERFNEVWWFYCSSMSDSIDRYVIYNHLEKVWSHGSLARSAWLDSPLRETPTALCYTQQVFYHEVGTDDGSTNPPQPIAAYAQTSDFDIDDGGRFVLVDKIIPDVSFNSSSSATPSVTMQLLPRQASGANYGAAQSPAVTSAQNYTTTHTYEVQQFSQQVFVRARGRQASFRIASTGLGTAWQLGVPEISMRPDGKR